MTPLPIATKSDADEDQQVNQASPSRQDFAFGLTSPVARQEQLLLSEYMSDVVFKVGAAGQLMHAHKLILTVASEVFYAQFNGGFDEAKQDNREKPIVIEDIEPAIFKQVLRYIYCEKVDLNIDNIMDVYCASEKYLLAGLKSACKKFLKTTLNVENVLKVFNANRQYGLADVDELCLNIIRDNPIKCFQSDDFLALSQPAVELIAACRTMNCQKDQLATAIEKWRKASESEADIKPQMEGVLCSKVTSFSTFRYANDVSTDLKIKVKGTMHLHGVGIFVGIRPNSVAPFSVDITVKIEPWNVTVSRTVLLKKNLYVEKIMFEKLTVTDECRIIVTVPKTFLFCLEEFKPVDTLAELELTVTDMRLGEVAPPAMNSSGASLFVNYNPVPFPPAPLALNPAPNDFGRSIFSRVPQTSLTPRVGTNCVAYILYSLDPSASTTSLGIRK